MKEINDESINFSLYNFYKTYNEVLTATQDYINTLENEVVEGVPEPLPTIKEFKFLR